MSSGSTEHHIGITFFAQTSARYARFFSGSVSDRGFNESRSRGSISPIVCQIFRRAVRLSFPLSAISFSACLNTSIQSIILFVEFFLTAYSDIISTRSIFHIGKRNFSVKLDSAPPRRRSVVIYFHKAHLFYFGTIYFVENVCFQFQFPLRPFFCRPNFSITFNFSSKASSLSFIFIFLSATLNYCLALYYYTTTQSKGKVETHYTLLARYSALYLHSVPVVKFPMGTTVTRKGFYFKYVTLPLFRLARRLKS